jgi:hypothetical protein
MARKKLKRRPGPGPFLSATAVEQRLLATSFPRLHMVLIISLAALGAFLCSASLVSLGVGNMGVRYALAVVGGYLSFLSFVRLWIAYQTRNRSWARDQGKRSGSFDSNIELPDLSSLGDLGGAAESAFSGGGGAFGGAGASGSFGDAAPSGGGSSGALDAVGSADEGLPILIAVIALLGGLIALGFVVYSSPILFAEVLLDVAVVGAVYKKNRRHERGHWAAGVLGRTYKPALVLGVFAALFGFAAQRVAPEQTTLGGVLRANDAKPE